MVKKTLIIIQGRLCFTLQLSISYLENQMVLTSKKCPLPLWNENESIGKNILNNIKRYHHHTKPNVRKVSWVIPILYKFTIVICHFVRVDIWQVISGDWTSVKQKILSRLVICCNHYDYQHIPYTLCESPEI